MCPVGSKSIGPQVWRVDRGPEEESGSQVSRGTHARTCDPQVNLVELDRRAVALPVSQQPQVWLLSFGLRALPGK